MGGGFVSPGQAQKEGRERDRANPEGAGEGAEAEMGETGGKGAKETGAHSLSASARVWAGG